MIEELNNTVWAKLAPSKLHGIGVFAIRFIPKGQKIYCQVLPSNPPLKTKSFEGLLPEVRGLIFQRWPLAEKGEVFQSPNDDARLVSFMNDGGKERNYDFNTDCAISDIKEGEEITEDYSGYTQPE